jgi:dipeptidyl aminopeptidase/acylaminoacyl peptidase
MKKQIQLSFLLFGLMMISIVGTAQKRSLNIDDLFHQKNVSNPQISPEGDWIAYTITTTDKKTDKRSTRIWMSPTDGGEAIPMTAEGYSASSPAWSPDGKYLTFLASKGEKAKSQVWALNRKGGEAQALTKVKHGVSGYEWSPDGSQLLLMIKDPKPEDKNEEGKEKPKPYVIDRLQFKRDYTGYLDRRRTHLYVQSVGDTTVTQITSGDFDDSSPAWSPDGKLIAFVSNRTENPDGNSNSDIWVVAADNTDKGQTLLQITKNPGSDGSPTWNPDGKSIAHISSIEPDLLWYATNHLAITPANGKGKTTYPTKDLDRNFGSPQFSKDGQYIYAQLEDSGEEQFVKVDLKTKKVERLIKGENVVQTYHMNDKGQVATLVSTPTMPSEVYQLKGGELKPISKANDEWLEKLQLSNVENIHFKSKDGTEIEGFLYKPIGYKENLQYPTILWIHGGPVSQFNFSFNFTAQLYAAQGYAVVMANPRGSSGYGQDFSKAIFADWGNKDYQDVMAAVDHVVEKGVADPERLGVGGWSYGGILTNYVITKTDRFKGAMTGASEVLYVANYGHDHYQKQWEAELGLPWENREAWERISPFNYVENIVTPTLIMGGAVDWNVPIHNSEQLYQSLKRLGRETQLIVYPDEHHGIRRPSFQVDRFQRWVGWYDKYVKEIVKP